MRWEDAALGVRRGAALGQLPYQTMLERQFDGIRPRDLCSVPTFAALAWNGVRPGARWPSSLRGLFDHLARRPVLLGEGSGKQDLCREPLGSNGIVGALLISAAVGPSVQKTWE